MTLADDGGGYLDGLAGAEISQAGRIVAIGDARGVVLVYPNEPPRHIGVVRPSRSGAIAAAVARVGGLLR